jgi:hypothetical protein
LAHAEFRAPPPPPPFDGGSFECSIVREQPPARDTDPVYKVNINVTINSGRLQGIGVVHTVRSGRTYDRSQQYSNATIWKTPDRMEWYWQGYRGPMKMVGEIYYNDRDGWMYSETISKNGRIEYRMLSDCHQQLGYGPEPPDAGKHAQQECYGILHKDPGGLVFGGGKGEDEGICVISKSEEHKVLATCSPERYCRVTGIIELCKDSGECAEVTRVLSVQRR